MALRRRGRRGAYLHQDAVNGVLRARKGARLTAVTSGGAMGGAADPASIRSAVNMRVVWISHSRRNESACHGRSD